MASTYSPSLRLELIGDGDQSGIWGQTTNNNLGYLLEQSVAGVITITMTDANYTLSNYNGVVDEARNQVLVMSGTLTATRNVIAPLVEKTYIVKNSTTGAQSIQIIGSSGLGVTIPNGITAYVYCDGTNFYNAISGSVGSFTVNGNLSVTGNETITGTLGVTGATTFTGIPSGPTATTGNNTTQLATTAFVQASTTALGLGTMSTQNANAVAITGGTVTGITDLAVADGGTGRSTLTANAVLVGNGTSGINSVSPGTSGNVLTSNGTTWTSGSAPAPTSGAGGLGNGTSFSITTGSSGVALITVEFLSLASFGNFGGATGYLDINGSTVASKYTQTIEYSSRNSGCGGVILYRYAGSANSTVTGTFSWSGAGSLNSASYMYIGI